MSSYERNASESENCSIFQLVNTFNFGLFQRTFTNIFVELFDNRVAEQ
jgi:hypothetical protein